MGERPAILSRGYARRRAEDGVVVVRDADGIRADLDRSGDEPLMLARQLPGVAVLASSDRYLAGPPRRAPLRRDGARPRRRVSAPAARSGHRPGHRRGRGSRGRRPDAAGRPPARAARHAARGRRDPRRRRARVRARPAAAARAVRDVHACAARWATRSPAGRSEPARPRRCRSLALAGIARPSDSSRSCAPRAGHRPTRAGFADHHRYSRGDLERIVRDGARRRRGRAC